MDNKGLVTPVSADIPSKVLARRRFPKLPSRWRWRFELGILALLVATICLALGEFGRAYRQYRFEFQAAQQLTNKSRKIEVSWKRPDWVSAWLKNSEWTVYDRVSGIAITNWIEETSDAAVNPEVTNQAVEDSELRQMQLDQFSQLEFIKLDDAKISLETLEHLRQLQPRIRVEKNFDALVRVVDEGRAKREVIFALLKSGDPRTRSVLKRFAESNDPSDSVSWATLAFASFHDPAIEPILIGQLSSGKDDRAAFAAYMLIELGTWRSIGPLVKLMDATASRPDSLSHLKSMRALEVICDREDPDGSNLDWPDDTADRD